MPFALVIIGLIMIVSGVRDTHSQLAGQLKSDLTGQNNFIQYALAIFAVGALGYVDKLRGISTALMALIIISLVLSNRGVFQKLQEAIAAGPEAPTPNPISGPAAGVSDAAGSLENFRTPFANSGTYLGKFLNSLKPPAAPTGGAGW